MKKLLILTTMLISSSCTSEFERIKGCEVMNGLTPICQFHHPEDIVALPDGKTIIVSEMGSMDGDIPGVLSVYNIALDKRTVLFAGAKGKNKLMGENWGNAECPGIPGENFSPHGIDLLVRKDSRIELMVVNHGGREAVEFFELTQNDNTTVAHWRGCVPVPNDEFMNDVAALSDGGFIASNMFDKNVPYFLGVSTGWWKSIIGIDTGYLFEWQQSTGFKIIPGSEAPFINGLSISADEKYVFANTYSGNEVRKINRVSGGVEGVVELLRPDNSAWDNDGKLLVASHSASIGDLAVCMDQSLLACPIKFSIVRIDPESLEVETILEQEGAPIGAGTVATQVGDKLYIGSYAGNRIVTFPYK